MKRYMKSANIILTLFVVIVTVIPLYASEKLTFSAVEGSLNNYIGERVLREAYGRIGIEIAVGYYPAEKAINTSNKGRADGEITRIFGIDNKYSNLIMVSVPVNKLEGVVFTIKTEFPVRGWESLKPYKVGIRRGIKFAEIGLKKVEGIYTHTVSRDEQLFKLLKVGRVDIAVIARLNGLSASQKSGIPGIRILEPPVENFPLYHYLHRKNKHLLPEITASLQEMEKEGLIQKIRDEFIAENFGRKQ